MDIIFYFENLKIAAEDRVKREG